MSRWRILRFLVNLIPQIRRVITVAIADQHYFFLCFRMFIIMNGKRTIITTEIEEGSLMAFGYRDLQNVWKSGILFQESKDLIG